MYYWYRRFKQLPCKISYRFKRLTRIWPNDLAHLDVHVIVAGLFAPNGILLKSIHASNEVCG